MRTGESDKPKIFSDYIPDTLHISAIHRHYNVTINHHEARISTFPPVLLSNCKIEKVKLSGGRSGGSTAGSDALAPAQGSHASQALSLKLKEDLSGTGPSLSTAWMP